MPKREAKPTPEMVDETVTAFEKLWSGAKGKWNEYDRLYNRTGSIWPKGMDREQYHSPKPTNVIDHAVDIHSTATIRVRREALGDTDTAIESASNLQVALRKIMEASSAMEPQDPWRATWGHLLHNGYAVVEGPMWDAESRPATPDPNGYDDKEEYDDAVTVYNALMRRWNPIRIRSIHPSRVLMDPEEPEPTFAVKRTRMYAHKIETLSIRKKKDLGARMADALNMDGRKPFDELELIDYWNPHWRMVKISSGQTLWVQPNVWGFIPYDQAYAGFGIEMTEADGRNPKWLAKGLLEAIMDTIMLKNQSTAGKHRIEMLAAFAKMATTGDPVELFQQMQSGSFVHVDGPVGQEIGFIPAPDVQRWMFEHDAELDRDIRESTSFVEGTSGLKQPGVDTVGQQAMLTTNSQQKFVHPAARLEWLASRKARKVLQLVDTHDTSIYGLSKKEIKGVYDADVSFGDIDPIMQMQREEQGLRKMESGALDRVTYWEDYERVEDVAKRKRRLDLQRVMERPAVLEILATNAAKANGMEELLEEARELERQMAEQSGPQAREISQGGGGMIDQMSGNSQRLRQMLNGKTANPPRASGMEAAMQEEYGG